MGQLGKYTWAKNRMSLQKWSYDISDEVLAAAVVVVETNAVRPVRWRPRTPRMSQLLFAIYVIGAKPDHTYVFGVAECSA